MTTPRDLSPTGLLKAEVPDRPGAGAALLGYLTLGVLLTWPLVLHLTDRLPLGNNDLWQNLWNFWWWKTALLEKHSLPYETDLLFYPGPTSLAFQTHSEANGLLAFPILVLWGPVAALNVATIVSFVLAGWGGYLLASEVVGDRRAAFLAGFVFAFFPQHFEQSLEHLSLASYGAMALFLWALLRAVRRGGTSSWIVVAAFFSLNGLFAWHNAILIFPGALIVFTWEIFANSWRPRGRIIGGAVLASVLALLIVSLFAWPMLREIFAGETYYLKEPVHKPIDLLFLGVPPENHTLWGSWVSGLYSEYRRYQSTGFTAYLGWVPLALAAAGWCFALRRCCRAANSTTERADTPKFAAGLWSVFFFLYIALSLGDELRVAGEDTGLPMPFSLLRELPLFGTSRVANRFLVPAMLALAMLAAWGVRELMSRSRRPGVVFCIASTLVLTDFLSIPYPLREVPQPAWVEKLETAAPGALLNIPGGYRARAAEDMFFQTYHGRPLIGGYVSCTPTVATERIATFPFLRTIYEGRPKIEVPTGPGLRRVLAELPVGIVAVHLRRVREDLEQLRDENKGRPQARLYNPDKGIRRSKLEEIRAALRLQWGQPYYADEEVELYRRPE